MQTVIFIHVFLVSLDLCVVVLAYAFAGARVRGLISVSGGGVSVHGILSADTTSETIRFLLVFPWIIADNLCFPSFVSLSLSLSSLSWLFFFP